MKLVNFNDTLDLISQIIGSDGITSGVSEADIENFEQKYYVRLPDSYRQFLREFGTVDYGGLRIYGLGVPSHLLPSVECALNVLHSGWREIPNTLVPIYNLAPGVFACLDCPQLLETSPVVQLDLNNFSPEKELLQLAPSFEEFLSAKVMEYYYFLKGFRRLEQHFSDQEFHWNYQEGGKLPRLHQWRPFRFCVQDVVLGVIVLCHDRHQNCLIVDVFLTASIPEYEADSGVRALALIMLSEAYHAGGTMEIQFTEHVEDRTVPKELVQLANQNKVDLKHLEEGRLVPNEAVNLYIALTEFSPRLHTQLRTLENSGRLSAIQVCYAIHHGIWERSEVEAIVLTCPYPERLLRGESKPEQRQLYIQNLFYGRAAVLYGNLERHLRARSHPKGQDVILLEDDERALEIDFDENNYAVAFRCPQEEINIPWLLKSRRVDGYHALENIPANQPFTVLVRARDRFDLLDCLHEDVRQACRIYDPMRSGPVYILVPRDFEKLPENFRSEVIKDLPEGINIMVYREFVSALDEEVAQRLKRSGGLRE